MNYIECEGHRLELTENSPVLITKSISDVLEPEKRKRDYSKEIVLPGTKNNLKFFKGYFSFTSTATDLNFDATKKIKADYYSNSSKIFSNAFLFLNNVTLKDGVFYFSINLFSELKNVFIELKKYDVNSLDYSDMNHVLSKTAIKNSWSFVDDYVYSLIDAGNRDVLDVWRTTDFYPYVRVSRIIDQMLIQIGVDPSSYIFSNEIQDYLDEMVYGFGGGEKPTLSPTEISERLVDAEGTFGYTPTPTLGLTTLTDIRDNYGALVTNTITSNTLGQYTPYIIQVARTGRYLITFNVDGESTFPAPLPSPAFPREKVFETNVSIYVNGTLKKEVKDIADIYVINNSIDLELYSGDLIEFYFYGGQYLEFIATSDPFEPITFAYVIPISVEFDFEIKIESKDETILDGATVNVGDYLPSISCSDFFNGIITIFNLYLSDGDTNTEIDTLNKFYNPTNTAEDITELVDYSKDITLIPLANEFAKNIHFKYKENKDFENQTYFQKFGINYGDFEIENQSDFATGEKVFQLPFSNVVPSDSIIGVDAVIPRFVLDKGNGVFEPNKGAPRIAFHNPITCEFRLADGSGANIETITSAASLHHFNDYTDPTFDLNFTLVREVYYTVTKVTVNNLFNEFYSQFIEESTSKDARLLKLYVKYNDYDIKNMSLKDLRYYKGTYYRLNKVEDFNGNTDSPDTTKVELIKVLKPVARPAISFPPMPMPVEPYLKNSIPVLMNIDLGPLFGTQVVSPIASKNTNFFIGDSGVAAEIIIRTITIDNAIINVYNNNSQNISVNFGGFVIDLLPAGTSSILKFDGTSLIKLY